MTTPNGDLQPRQTFRYDDVCALRGPMYPAADPLDYVFHSIIGIAPNPAGGAWPPGAAVEPLTCGAGAINNGSVYQELSNTSNGLRFPLCDNDNFDDIFSAIADDVINGVFPSMHVLKPVDTGNGTPDPDLTAVVYEPSDGSGLQSLERVADVSACVDGAYYLEGNNLHAVHSGPAIGFAWTKQGKSPWSSAAKDRLSISSSSGLDLVSSQTICWSGSRVFDRGRSETKQASRRRFQSLRPGR